ncbi:glycerol-3-phosphate acyltransferase [Myxosarcina sp. GI1]|uniref:glycerol-3-phosphate acyltransferase n=1 Tax=Myxosarcina sp. GI1 TaxID=1541065 RepID=UPI00055FD261|nr:glycerol-3-phosphate acyltransferase [Myxosarcina sp. GI1]
MNLTPIWGSLVILLICPLIGGLPLIDWMTYAITGRQLSKLGTGNISVSAAFYHGGKLAGILAVLSEAAKGIIAVLLVRAFFPNGSVWEIIAIVALVAGRYWLGKSAGTTNAVWGIITHDLLAAGLIFLISLVSFTVIRDRQMGKFGALILLAIIIGLQHPQEPEYAIAAAILGGLLAWIYTQIPDDLDLAATAGQTDTQSLFRFFQGDKNIVTLDSKLNANKVGNKAANLSLLKRLGYDVPQGWVLAPGEDFQPLVEYLQPSVAEPLIVRSSAVGEDSLTASAAGQYLSIANVTNSMALKQAILECQSSYFQSNAIEYRQNRSQKDLSLAILLQKQVKGEFSGVAFSRDPIDSFNDSVAIEALPGEANKVVSGKFTPQRYCVAIPDSLSQTEITISEADNNDSTIIIPRHLLESVALLAREMEDLFESVPQDIEWTYDGEKLWLLQVRPITNLQPVWTRRIAAEVIPGKIPPLTWSINQPLTCGVWGQLFTLVLGKKARDLDFNQTATLHFSSAYFNATLLGTIFRRMGLPSESLEFLTRGSKFSKPPLTSTIKNFPGLWRLLRLELSLIKDFDRDRQKTFAPILQELKAQTVGELSASEIVSRIETILEVLTKVTYYSILAPLSLALRRAILQVPETSLDNSKTPEVAAVHELADLATDIRKLLASEQITMDSSASLFAHIAENADGENILEQFNIWLDKYGYLSEAATDISIPRWQDKPSIPREMLAQYFFDREKSRQARASSDRSNSSWKTKIIQARVDLKGEVSEIYNRLLAYLRWSFLALGTYWQRSGAIEVTEDIFFLSFEEIKRIEIETDLEFKHQFSQQIAQRNARWQREKELTAVPYIVYGQPNSLSMPTLSALKARQQLTGIGTSTGQIEGTVKVVCNLRSGTNIDRQTIIVVPHTDAGWSPLLARAGGLISEVGGRLSHGAIVAREYNIPAVMDIPNATRLLKNGQRVRMNGQTGIVEILS